ncbi:MAG: nitroreductase family protein [Planctomycetota bacterium]
MEKSAPAELPILDMVKRRWSPRAFADRPVEDHKLRCILEAARWSASSYNEQPWRWILAKKADGQPFDTALSCLAEANQAWAKDAPILLITFVKTDFDKNGKPNRVAEHDLGAAMAQLSLQATAMGLFVHQMAGVDLDKVAQTYNPPDNFKPCTAAAIGYGGQPDSLPEEWMRDAETAERTRLPRTDLVFADTFGNAHPVMKLD